MEGIGGFIEGAQVLRDRIAQAGEWKLCDGRTRCDTCGEMVETTWRFYLARTLTYVRCLCGACAEKEI
jgi:hypothetical protein